MTFLIWSRTMHQGYVSYFPKSYIHQLESLSLDIVRLLHFKASLEPDRDFERPSYFVNIQDLDIIYGCMLQSHKSMYSFWKGNTFWEIVMGFTVYFWSHFCKSNGHTSSPAEAFSNGTFEIRMGLWHVTMSRPIPIPAKKYDWNCSMWTKNIWPLVVKHKGTPWSELSWHVSVGKATDMQFWID